MWYKNYHINPKVFNNKVHVALRAILCGDGLIIGSSMETFGPFYDIEEEIIILAIRKLLVREIEDGFKNLK